MSDAVKKIDMMTLGYLWFDIDIKNDITLN